VAMLIITETRYYLTASLALMPVLLHRPGHPVQKIPSAVRLLEPSTIASCFCANSPATLPTLKNSGIRQVALPISAFTRDSCPRSGNLQHPASTPSASAHSRSAFPSPPAPFHTFQYPLQAPHFSVTWPQISHPPFRTSYVKNLRDRNFSISSQCSEISPPCVPQKGSIPRISARNPHSVIAPVSPTIAPTKRRVPVKR